MTSCETYQIRFYYVLQFVDGGISQTIQHLVDQGFNHKIIVVIENHFIDLLHLITSIKAI